MLIVAIAAVWLLVNVSKDDSLARLRNAGTIRIGYAVEAPYAFVTQDGTVTGESPEIAKHIAKTIGIDQITWRQAEFGSLINELEAGRIDVVAAGMFVTPERKMQVAFSAPTFQVRPGLLVPAGNPLRLYSYKELATHDVTVAVLNGSVEENTLRRLGVPSRRLLAVPDTLTGLAAVTSGLAAGMAISSPTARWIAQHSKEQVEAAEAPARVASDSLGLGAFAFRKEDRALLEAWNRALDGYIGTKEHLTLVSRFGFTADELPPTAKGKSEPRP
ncbi:ectoine/hydroxyectoine ABC transporter substrate-binding protein EhuB [Geomonas edaphica]|uniref:ectoine/hydroxyectoine ABC transporter substrate-binding protein EhuB n=1 Tax=Geomonas edaphica TaxID=2570226 RepID=UPI002482F405|nr:ectoine/hydroxyectoine ABC transporter substrate-binding protein EhuB [Geomonas edaphica]